MGIQFAADATSIAIQVLDQYNFEIVLAECVLPELLFARHICRIRDSHTKDASLPTGVLNGRFRSRYLERQRFVTIANEHPVVRPNTRSRVAQDRYELERGGLLAVGRADVIDGRIVKVKVFGRRFADLLPGLAGSNSSV